MSEDAFEAQVQQFFDSLLTETRKPHYGHHAREVIQQLLLRAQEAGIYQPKGSDDAN